MTTAYAGQFTKDFSIDPGEDVKESIFKQYERVVIESIITSFGLDFLVRDQHGGDVDTIHNVRQIGKDPDMGYKNKANEAAYENSGEYVSREYHGDKSYIEKNRAISERKEQGTLRDEYTGKRIPRNERSDLDHVISAKEIHEDRGRVLAGLKGPELANSDENLKATNPHTNRSKGAGTMEEHLAKHGDEYTAKQRENMMRADKQARAAYNRKINYSYYTSYAFTKDMALAAGNVGLQMGLRQVLGFAFTEIWFSVKEEFQRISGTFELGEFFKSIGRGIKRGFERAKEKYSQLLEKFKEGVVAGALSSLTTTLCNIFFTTAKNIVRILRQTWASLVQAAKILLFNPDNLPWNERIVAAIKVLTTGACVVLGTVVSEVVSKTPIGQIPVIGGIVSTFCGTLVTGITSCTLLYFIDHGSMMKELVAKIKNMFKNLFADRFALALAQIKEQIAQFEKFAAELMKIDLEAFKREIALYDQIAEDIDAAASENELNTVLLRAIKTIGGKIPWEGDFNTFMGDRNNRLVFE